MIVFKPIWTVLIVLTISQTGWTRSNGPPLNSWSTVCSTLAPDPGQHRAPPQDGEIPYQLTVDTTSVEAGGEVNLEITKIDSSTDDFRGFVVQGVDSSTGDTVGTFDVDGSDAKVKNMTCNGVEGSTVSHGNANPVSSQSLKWRAPSSQVPRIVRFLFTVVRQRTMYWVRRNGQQQVQLADINGVTIMMPTTTAPPETETEAENSTNSKYLSHIHEALIVVTWIASTFSGMVMRM